MVIFASEVFVDFYQLFGYIQHLGTERYAFPTLYATVRSGVIINQCEILHCAGFGIVQHVCDVIFGQAVDDVNPVGAWHAVAASCTAVSEKCPVLPCNFPYDFLVVVAYFIHC